MKEKTIKTSVSKKGIGLHTGKEGWIELFPLPEGSGIVFEDLDTGERIRASINNVVGTNRGIVLGGEKSRVKTPEHFLSALYALGITNLLIKYKNEIPALDGSARLFIDLIEKAGIIEQNRDRNIYILEDPIFLKDDGKLAVALPSSKLRIRYLIDYPDTYIESEYYDFLFSKEEFIKDISYAKTFGLGDEREKLIKQNLSLGGSPNNALLVMDKQVIGDLRVKREFVKHKIVDFLGDISLLNVFVIADFLLIKTGHEFHVRLAKKIKDLGGLSC